jgi:hypothetical protein
MRLLYIKDHYAFTITLHFLYPLSNSRQSNKLFGKYPVEISWDVLIFPKDEKFSDRILHAISLFVIP